MAIEKQLTPLTNGVDSSPIPGAELEIEIVNPDMVTLDDVNTHVDK